MIMAIFASHSDREEPGVPLSTKEDVMRAREFISWLVKHHPVVSFEHRLELESLKRLTHDASLRLSQTESAINAPVQVLKDRPQNGPQPSTDRPRFASAFNVAGQAAIEVEMLEFPEIHLDYRTNPPTEREMMRQDPVNFDRLLRIQKQFMQLLEDAKKRLNHDVKFSFEASGVGAAYLDKLIETLSNDGFRVQVRDSLRFSTRLYKLVTASY